MRIIVLINYVSPYRIPLFELLSSNFKDLTIFTSVVMGKDRNWQQSIGKFHEFRQKSLIVKQNWRHPEGFNDQIYIYIPLNTLRELIIRKPNIIISHEFGIRSFQCMLYKVFHRKSTFIIWANLSDHTEKNRGVLRLILRKILIRSVDEIWVNGKAGERYIRKIDPNFASFRHFPYPTDNRFLNQPKIKELNRQSITFLTVGNLIERKGLIIFLNTLSTFLIENPNINIIYNLIGEGPLKSVVENFPTPKNLQINLSGFLPYENLPVEYSKADFFVFPTLADEWGVVVNEAMASGLPVIGSCYSQAVEEMVIEGETGWIFNPDEMQNTISALSKALSIQQNDYLKMSISCKNMADKISMENVAKGIISAINQISSKY